MKTPEEILYETDKHNCLLFLNDGERGIIIQAMRDYAKDKTDVIDQLIREADYREMDIKELQEKYDALTTYINERKQELSQPYHSEHSNASRPID